MSVRRRQIADRLLAWIDQGERLKEIAPRHCRVARYVAAQHSRMGRYVRYRQRRWAEFLAWAGR